MFLWDRLWSRVYYVAERRVWAVHSVVYGPTSMRVDRHWDEISTMLWWYNGCCKFCNANGGTGCAGASGCLDLSLAETPTRWWATHKEELQDWEDTAVRLQACFWPDFRVMLTTDGSNTSIMLPQFETMWMVVRRSGKLRPFQLINGCINSCTP